jgi:hypothetical protein
MFTLQQIQEISKKLSAMCKKDSDFKPLDDWTSISKKDFIAFVKDGKNRSMTLDQLYTFVRQNINGDIGDALQRIEVLEGEVLEINTLLNAFIERTNIHFDSIDKSLEDINRVLSTLTTKYTLTVEPVTPNATVFINGIEQSSLQVVNGSTVNVKVQAEGYVTYEEFVLVDKDITLRPELSKEQVTFTVSPIPDDCTVRLNRVTGKSITVDKGSTVTWEVSKSGYITKSGSEVVQNSITFKVALDVIGSDESNFTINVLKPLDAVVTINGKVTNSVIVKKGTEVTWSVEAPHYEPQSGTQTITEDTVKDITLVAEQVTLTVAVVPMPMAASLKPTVELNGVVRDSITVDYNTKVHIKISSAVSKTYEEDYTVTETETKSIEVVSEIVWDNLTITQADSSPNPINNVSFKGGDIALKAMVSVRYSDNSTEIRDVTSDSTGTLWMVVQGEGITSKGNGIFTWSENTNLAQRTATIRCNASNPAAHTTLKADSDIPTIQQEKQPEQLEIVPASLEFSAEGGKETVQITSNTSWSIQ